MKKYLYLVYFESKHGDILPKEVKAMSIRDAIVKSSLTIKDKKAQYIPVKCVMLNMHDIIKYKDIRSEHVIAI